MATWWNEVPCCECGEVCRTVEGAVSSRCRACLIFREVYPLFENLSPSIETT